MSKIADDNLTSWDIATTAASAGAWQNALMINPKDANVIKNAAEYKAFMDMYHTYKTWVDGDFISSVDNIYKDNLTRQGYKLPSFDVGTSYVRGDQIAQIHDTEMIIDPQSSNVLRKYGINVNSNNLSNDDIIVELRKMSARLESIEKSTKISSNVLNESQYGQRTMKVELVS
jgi:hypothetical protein